MKGEFYILLQISPDSSRLVYGPRGTRIIGLDEALWVALVAVPSWVHRDRPGAIKSALRGWKTLAGLLRAKSWKTRTVEYRRPGTRTTLAVYKDNGDDLELYPIPGISPYPLGVSESPLATAVAGSEPDRASQSHPDTKIQELSDGMELALDPGMTTTQTALEIARRLTGDDTLTEISSTLWISEITHAGKTYYRTGKIGTLARRTNGLGTVGEPTAEFETRLGRRIWVNLHGEVVTENA